ncbi:MAG: 5-oxoprolinase subunit PxpB [Geodermatophilaceae bacterium]|nr:5-oxoprolinase subunit PxpB [Geodermatophilaceae bacterium]
MIDVRPYGEHALLVELPAEGAVLAMAASLAADPVPGVEEIVPADTSLLLWLTPGADAAAVTASVRRRRVDPADRPPGELVEIPVVYDGPDLDEVAALTGLSVAEVVARHTGTELIVAFCGFTPGFAYLSGLSEQLRVPRRDSPRTRVPAGAVGLAHDRTGVYPRDSPGGWQLIGRTDVVLWDLDRDPPALLRPGLRVRFTES